VKRRVKRKVRWGCRKKLLQKRIGWDGGTVTFSGTDGRGKPQRGKNCYQGSQIGNEGNK